MTKRKSCSIGLKLMKKKKKKWEKISPVPPLTNVPGHLLPESDYPVKLRTERLSRSLIICKRARVPVIHHH